MYNTIARQATPGIRAHMPDVLALAMSMSSSFGAKDSDPNLQNENKIQQTATNTEHKGGRSYTGVGLAGIRGNGGEGGG